MNSIKRGLLALCVICCNAYAREIFSVSAAGCVIRGKSAEFLLVFDGKLQHPVWCKVGDRVDDVVILSFDLETERLHIAIGGRVKEVTLSIRNDGGSVRMSCDNVILVCASIDERFEIDRRKVLDEELLHHLAIEAMSVSSATFVFRENCALSNSGNQRIINRLRKIAEKAGFDCFKILCI